MSRVFSQTDVVAACGGIAACSGATVTGTPRFKDCEPDGTSGGAETFSIPSQTTRAALMYQIQGINSTSWEAGNWVIRFNLTTANADVTWEEAYICRLNNACVSQATVGSDVAVNQLMDTTGVKSVTISGAAQAGAAIDDDAYIVLVFSSAATHGNSSIGVTHDRDVDTPLLPLRKRRLIIG